MDNKHSEYESLVMVYSEDLYRFAVWLCKDPAVAEDLVQETYLRAWKSLSKLRDRQAAKAWLFTILRNEFSRQFGRYRPDFSDIDLAYLEFQDSQNDTRLEALVLRRALDELAVEYREPLLLQVLGGFSCEEIGAICGTSKGAIMTRLFRAKQKLREALDPSGEKT